MYMKGGILGAVMLAVAAATVAAPAAQASHLSDPTACTCSASVGLAKPDFQFVDGVLTLVPRVDFRVRSRGGAEAPPLTVSVNYEGSTAYESEDVTVPEGVAFSGQKQVVSGFPCNGTYRGSGIELTRVPCGGR